MLVRKTIPPLEKGSGVSPESFYEFFEELNKHRFYLGIINISVVLFISKKNPDTILHGVIEIETTLEGLFTFQYGLLKIWAAESVTLRAIDVIFGPQLENWSNKPDSRYQKFVGDKRVTKIQWSIGPDCANEYNEIICSKGKEFNEKHFLDNIKFKTLIKLLEDKIK